MIHVSWRPPKALSYADKKMQAEHASSLLTFETSTDLGLILRSTANGERGVAMSASVALFDIVPSAFRNAGDRASGLLNSCRGVNVRFDNHRTPQKRVVLSCF